MLLKHGTDVNAAKSNRVGPQTAIEMAASSGHHQCVDLLKRYGAVLRKAEDHHSKITTSVQMLTFKDTVTNEFMPLQPAAATDGTLSPNINFLTSSAVRKSLVTVGTSPAASNVPVQQSAGPWKTLRLFISSTFAGLWPCFVTQEVLTFMIDMHSERDHLIKNVIPKLRERCTDRRLHLVDIDLRWVHYTVSTKIILIPSPLQGVTEEESKSGTIPLCTPSY